MRATCTDYIILLDLITLTIFHEAPHYADEHNLHALKGDIGRNCEWDCVKKYSFGQNFYYYKHNTIKNH